MKTTLYICSFAAGMIALIALVIVGCFKMVNNPDYTPGYDVNVPTDTKVLVNKSKQLACIKMTDRFGAGTHVSSSCYSFTQMNNDPVLSQILADALQELNH